MSRSDFKKQVASPAREVCTPLEPAKTVGLLLNNPGFTFKGKILVKEEGGRGGSQGCSQAMSSGGSQGLDGF